jgi:cobalt-zinc-cadmium efflux system outer membrane protein
MNFTCRFSFLSCVKGPLPLVGALVFAGFAAAHAAEEPAPIPLDRLVAEITANNPELKFYEAEIAAARAARRTAGTLPDPELSLEAGRKRVHDAAGRLAGDGAAWSVAVRQTFEWPGRLGLRKSIANRQVELAELGLARFQSALAARARTLAFGLHVANARRAAVREVAERFTALKETFVAREPAGITPLLETRVIEASELALQRRAAEAELALQAALLELNQLRGVVADAPLRVTPATLKFGAPPDHAALLAAARENNFDYRIRRAELEQQGLAVQLARHERRPALSAGPYIAQERAGERETTRGLSLSMPLPVGARTRGAVEGAEARQRQAEAAVLLAERELEREVLGTAHAFATKLAEMGRWAPDSTTKFREAAELADRHYRLGAVPIATYVELQNSYLDAVDALLSTQQEALEAGLRLQQLTGLDFHAAESAP